MCFTRSKYWLLFFTFAICVQSSMLSSIASHNSVDNELSISADEIQTDDGDLDEYSINSGYGLAQKGLQKTFIIWPKGIIPYFIDDFSFDKGLRDKIRKHLEETSLQTGLQFLELPRPPDDNQTRWVLFINRRGLLPCDDFSTINFTKEGVQRVVVGYDCAGAPGGGLAAAVLALAGVPPQHNAPDRDQHIEILAENIIPDKLQHFIQIEKSAWLFEDMLYDFNSAGHYDLYQYTSNGHATLQVKRSPSSQEIFVDEITGLSDLDVLKIERLYESEKESNNKMNSSNCLQVFTPKNTSNSNSYRSLIAKIKSEDCGIPKCKKIKINIKQLKSQPFIKYKSKRIVQQLSDFYTDED